LGGGVVRVSTEGIRPGDVLAVWWPPKRDVVVSITDYDGPLECLRGARIAQFASNTLGMTLELGAAHEVLVRGVVAR
jgi:hypothetical protein